MKKLLAVCTALLLTVSLLACAKADTKDDAPVILAEPASESVSSVRVSGENLKSITLVNALANEANFLSLDENMRLLARAVLPDKSTTVDHWEINGRRVDSGGRRYTLEFDTEDTDVVSAVLRDKKTVRCVNSYLSFIDSKGNDIGKKYSRVRFEDDYTIPVTGEFHEGGTITCRITAVVPSGMEVDYWLFNGVAYRFDNTNVSSFVVVGLDSGMEYEPVFCPGSGRAFISLIIENRDPGFKNQSAVLFPDDRPTYTDELPDDDPNDFGEEYNGPEYTPEDSGTAEEHEHNFQLDMEASQTDEGHVFVCNESYTEPHSYDSNGVCTVCGHETHIHQWYLASSDRSGHTFRCISCGASYKEGHAWVRTPVGSVVSLTCPVCGYTT